MALNVPTLQAADMPLPHGQNNKFNILCVLGWQAAAGRRTQWVAQQLPAASVGALPAVPSPCGVVRPAAELPPLAQVYFSPSRPNLPLPAHVCGPSAIRIRSLCIQTPVPSSPTTVVTPSKGKGEYNDSTSFGLLTVPELLDWRWDPLRHLDILVDSIMCR